MKQVVVVILLVFISVGIQAQSKKKKSPQEAKFGVQFKPIIPINYFGAGPQNIKDTLIDMTISSKMGYNIGMIVRKDFTNLLSLETGINYTRRNYQIETYEAKRDTSDYADFGFVAYQIPVQALVYIRLAENLYMNTSGGFAVDFYPSHVQSQGTNYLIENLSFKRYWMNFSVLANIGFEYRTEKSGGFYLGASFVNPVKDILETRVNYYYDNAQKQRYTVFQRGTYITVDLRYFFP